MSSRPRNGARVVPVRAAHSEAAALHRAGGKAAYRTVGAEAEARGVGRGWGGGAMPEDHRPDDKNAPADDGVAYEPTKTVLSSSRKAKQVDPVRAFYKQASESAQSAPGVVQVNGVSRPSPSAASPAGASAPSSSPPRVNGFSPSASPPSPTFADKLNADKPKGKGPERYTPPSPSASPASARSPAHSPVATSSRVLHADLSKATTPRAMPRPKEQVVSPWSVYEADKPADVVRPIGNWAQGRSEFCAARKFAAPDYNPQGYPKPRPAQPSNPLPPATIARQPPATSSSGTVTGTGRAQAATSATQRVAQQAASAGGGGTQTSKWASTPPAAPAASHAPSAAAAMSDARAGPPPTAPAVPAASVAAARPTPTAAAAPSASKWSGQYPSAAANPNAAATRPASSSPSAQSKPTPIPAVSPAAAPAAPSAQPQPRVPSSATSALAAASTSASPSTSTSPTPRANNAHSPAPASVRKGTDEGPRNVPSWGASVIREDRERAERLKGVEKNERTAEEQEKDLSSVKGKEREQRKGFETRFPRTPGRRANLNHVHQTYDAARLASGGVRREKKSPEELEQLMAAMKLKNDQIRSKLAAAEEDRTAYEAKRSDELRRLVEEERERVKAEDESKRLEREKKERTAELQRLIDEERARSAALKLSRASGRAWDADKSSSGGPPAPSSPAQYPSVQAAQRAAERERAERAREPERMLSAEEEARIRARDSVRASEGVWETVVHQEEQGRATLATL